MKGLKIQRDKSTSKSLLKRWFHFNFFCCPPPSNWFRRSCILNRWTQRQVWVNGFGVICQQENNRLTNFQPIKMHNAFGQRDWLNVCKFSALQCSRKTGQPANLQKSVKPLEFNKSSFYNFKLQVWAKFSIFLV